MPQMNPMSWMLLMFMFIILILITNAINFFFINKKVNKTNFISNKKMNKNWKW